MPGANAEAAGGTTAARPVGDAGGAAGSPTSDNAKAAAGLGAARAVATVVAGTMPPAGSAGTAVVASVLGAIRTSAESAEADAGDWSHARLRVLRKAKYQDYNRHHTPRRCDK